MKISIIIPVYNEKKTIGQILKKVFESKLPNGIEKEIIIVDDGSTDSSKFKIQSMSRAKSRDSKLKKIKLIIHEKNLGKGAAIRTGIKHAGGDLIIIQDADLEYDPKDYSRLIEPIIKEGASVVYGTRLTNYPLRLWGKNKTVLPTHLIANRFLTTLTNILFGAKLTDMETGYKAFTKEALRNIILKSNRFDIEVELTAKFLKKGIKITEVPIVTRPRTYQEGKKIGIFDGLVAIWTIFKYRFSD